MTGVTNVLLVQPYKLRYYEVNLRFISAHTRKVFLSKYLLLLLNNTSPKNLFEYYNRISIISISQLIKNKNKQCVAVVKEPRSIKAA